MGSHRLVVPFLLWLVSLTSLSWTSAQQPRAQTLKYVHAIWRHGDRSPSATFPTDVNNTEATWPQGWGELTPKGMQQHYELGQWLRKRYQGYLSDDYSQYEIYVRSTSYNRTIMSAQANMAGLFPPKGDHIWNKQLLWQPIPVHSQPKEEDALLWMDIPCPTAERLFAELQQSTEVRQIVTAHQPLFDKLATLTGFKRHLQLEDVWLIFDPLYCELMHNETHTWPDWVTAGIWQELVQLYDLSFKYYFYTVEIQRLRGGMLLGDILERMQRRTEGRMDSREKFYAISSHDTTVAAILANLGAIQERAPTYADVVLIELHERGGHYEIEVYYRNETGRDPYVIQVGDCPRPCSLKQFEVRSTSRIPKNWRKECGLKPWYYAEPRTYLTVIVLLLVMVLVLLSIVGIYAVIAVKRFREQSRYNGRHLIPTEVPDEDG